MRDFMITLLTCSAAMSAAALFYMAVTPLIAKRYSARGRYYAWLVVVIGLIVPFRPQPDNAIVTVNMPSEAALPVIQISNVTMTAASFLPSVSLWQIAGAAWFAGMFVAVACHAIRHYRFMKTARHLSEKITGEPTLTLFQNLKSEMKISRRIGVYFCGAVGSPMLTGFIKPRIFLPPKEFSQDELRFILKHELIHFKRKDLYYKCAVLLAACIHWFNPFLYMIAKAIDISCEISCDDEVVRSTGIEARRHYSETIIGAARYQSNLRAALSTNFHGGKNSMKKRIFSIMDSGKKKAGIAVVCAALVITLGTGFAFAANTAMTEPSPEYERFGISYNDEGKMIFDGKTVRYFWDGFYVDYPSYATIYEYFDEEGVVDVHTVRSVTDNGDGSINPAGELLEIVAYSQQEFDARDIDRIKNPVSAAAQSGESGNEDGSTGTGRTIAEIMEDYEIYGIKYERRADGTDNMGNIFYNGRLVKTFVDKENDGGILTFSSADGGEITVRTVYDDNGRLTGVEESQR